MQNKSILMLLTALSSSLSLSQVCSRNSVMFRGALVIHAVQDIHRALFLPLPPPLARLMKLVCMQRREK